jgi:hypothetical protein
MHRADDDVALWGRYVPLHEGKHPFDLTPEDMFDQGIEQGQWRVALSFEDGLCWESKHDLNGRTVDIRLTEHSQAALAEVELTPATWSATMQIRTAIESAADGILTESRGRNIDDRLVAREWMCCTKCGEAFAIRDWLHIHGWKPGDQKVFVRSSVAHKVCPG